MDFHSPSCSPFSYFSPLKHIPFSPNQFVTTSPGLSQLNWASKQYGSPNFIPVSPDFSYGSNSYRQSLESHLSSAHSSPPLNFSQQPAVFRYFDSPSNAPSLNFQNQELKEETHSLQNPEAESQTSSLQNPEEKDAPVVTALPLSLQNQTLPCINYSFVEVKDNLPKGGKRGYQPKPVAPKGKEQGCKRKLDQECTPLDNSQSPPVKRPRIRKSARIQQRPMSPPRAPCRSPPDPVNLGFWTMPFLWPCQPPIQTWTPQTPKPFPIPNPSQTDRVVQTPKPVSAPKPPQTDRVLPVSAVPFPIPKPPQMDRVIPVSTVPFPIPKPPEPVSAIPSPPLTVVEPPKTPLSEPLVQTPSEIQPLVKTAPLVRKTDQAPSASCLETPAEIQPLVKTAPLVRKYQTDKSSNGSLLHYAYRFTCHSPLEVAPPET